MKRRSWIEIYLDVLEAVSRMSGIRRIGNESNLPWIIASKYLESFEHQGLVRRTVEGESARDQYELTQKGFETLESLQKLTDAFTPLIRA